MGVFVFPLKNAVVLDITKGGQNNPTLKGK